MLKYTTADNIARRLKHRLELNQNTPPTLGQSQALGAKQIDYNLYEQLGVQVESRLDMALGMMYELPIPNDATDALNILASIVEKFVVAEILSTHYQQSQNAEMGGDQGYGSVLLKQAKEECAAIGIMLPGVAAIPSPPNTKAEFMVLPGVPKKGDIPDIVSRSYSFTAAKNSQIADINWGV